MATLDNRYTINGLVDTSKASLDGMTDIVNSCNTWLSYDGTIGKWAVIINQPGTVAFEFDDDNIIGPINLTTTDLGSLYNSVEVRFHNIDLRDRDDYVLLEIPAGQRLPNEPDNRLIINAPLVNNQIQAQLLGLIELKQARLDKVITFQSDFSYVGIEAGTIISVTNSVYGWTDKLFRVLQVSESEQDNTLLVNITAQEYDEDIYDDSDLFEYLRESQTGLIELNPLKDVSPITDNTEVVDGTNTTLPFLLALPTLFKSLDTYMNGNPNLASVVSSTASGLIGVADFGLWSFNSNNSTTFNTNYGITFWEREATFTVNVPDSGIIILADINGGCNVAFYESNFPISRGFRSNIYDNAGNVLIDGTSDYADPYNDLTYTAEWNTPGLVTFRLNVGVEQETGNPYVAYPTLMIFRKPA